MFASSLLLKYEGGERLKRPGPTNPKNIKPRPNLAIFWFVTQLEIKKATYSALKIYSENIYITGLTL